MYSKHNPTTESEILNLFANPEIALITGFSVVVGAALLVVLLMTISAVEILIEQAATGMM